MKSDELINSDELMHFGVKDMKWGKRKDNYSRGTSFGYRHYTKAANSAQRDADNLRKNGYKEEAKAVQKVADKNRVKAQASQNKRDAKNANKQAINKAYKKIQGDRTIMSKAAQSMGFGYNNATYRKAAKNMVNKGMDQKTAVSKAKMSAWKNAGMMVAGSLVYANRNKIISSVKKYANQKSIQRANQGLARIGTFQLEKVANNVYQEVMR